jgi:hypothetical protein
MHGQKNIKLSSYVLSISLLTLKLKACFPCTWNQEWLLWEQMSRLREWVMDWLIWGLFNKAAPITEIIEKEQTENHED